MRVKLQKMEPSLPVERRESPGFSDDQIIQMFLSSKSGSSHTYKSYMRAITRFREFIAYRMFNAVTWREIEAYKYMLMNTKSPLTGKPLAPASIASRIAPLKSLYKWGNDPNIGLFQNNPTTNIKMPIIPLNSKKHFLTKSEVGKLLQYLRQNSPRDYLICLTLLLLGLRVSELCGIRWSDFYTDPLESSIWLTVERGKGGKSRDIKVPATLWQMYHTLGLYKPNLQQPSDRVFPLSPRQLERIIQSSCVNSGLNKQVTPHWLRHTNATLALLNGASLQQVQETLGHAHINTTQRYLHTVEQLTKSASDYVSDMINEYLP
ncbi:tyrosine-type recombinase/integrase [Paenibacillus sp. J5C_2022]|uniref:tyrosine-type recombinase/integrase n=1 Tax=Paenibacillus sp. J5C2022 TaxID=2977129 RepID=UPI0021D2B142|nr:tyrosine-type recombinase/integrase [Paenibacillus sp. J5C2022]MCU6711632.1 tyrosine-type recombinase/integrase [Paenibacillus sp. J5C2022]